MTIVYRITYVYDNCINPVPGVLGFTRASLGFALVGLLVWDS